MSTRLFSAVLLSVLCAGAPALAKDSGVGLSVPGERWTWQSDIGMGSSADAEAAASEPYFAYIEPFRGSAQPEAISGAEVTLQHLSPGDRFLRYRVSFVVPDVDPGWYRVLICDLGCTNLLADEWLGFRLHVVESRLERRLRSLMSRSSYALEERIDSLRFELAAEREGRDIRLRYQASRSLDLAQRIERLEDRAPTTSGSKEAPIVWLVGMGFGGGLALSAIVGSLRRARAG